MNNIGVKRLDLRILLVEDSEEYVVKFEGYLARALEKHYNYKEYLQREETVADGLKALKEALSMEQPFDFAILDYKLPETSGGLPRESLELPEFVEDHPGCCHRMVQLTSFAEDPDVARFWSRRDSSHLLFSKHHVNHLIDFMEFHEIKEALEKLELSPVLSAESNRLPTEIGWLCARIKHTWEDLSEETRESVREKFNVTEPATSGEGIGIGFKM